MVFQPALPFNSVAGYRFLQRTQDRQLDAFSRSPQIQRDTEHFRQSAGEIRTIDDFFADRQIFRFTLTAFGLIEATDRQAFVRKAIEEGIADPEAFANRLGDRRYARFVEALGFQDGRSSRFADPAFQEDVIARFRLLSFEEAVGEIDVDQRLALNFRRESAEILNRDLPDRTLWLQLLGTRASRTVLEAGFNLPTEFVRLDLDRQVDILRSRAIERYGDASPRVLLDQGNLDNLLSRFFIRQDLQISNTSSASTALTILTSAGAGLRNLIQSGF